MLFLLKIYSLGSFLVYRNEEALVILFPDSDFFLFLFRYWLSVGAQPSEPVERLLFRAGILPPPPMVAMGRKGGARDTRSVDALTGRVLNQEKPANEKNNDHEHEAAENPF